MPAETLQTDAAIEARELVKRFSGGVRALDGVSLRIEAGEFFTLLGPSGCGKTTLLRLIAGFETPESGSLYLHGKPLDGLAPWQRPVNTVFQSYAVFPHLSVADNIGFGLRMQGLARDAITRRVRDMLALVRMEGFGARRPDQLSGGQLQRVALARALAPAPRVLLLDEPLSALDLKLRTEMQLELKRIQSGLGITFVFVTHDQQEALTMSDRVAVMRAGRICQIGTPQDIYERPRSRFVADFIGETNLLAAEPMGGRRFALPGGGELLAEHDGPGHVLAIRPERLRLVTNGVLTGRVTHMVYSGGDTLYEISLPGDVSLRVRAPNDISTGARAALGEMVGIDVPPAAVRVLEE